MVQHISIWTDGSCLRNPGKGGWAFVLDTPAAEYELSDNLPSTTNNAMELTAVIEAFRLMTDEHIVNLTKSVDHPKHHIKIYSDSQYVVKGITIWIHNWIKKNDPRPNWALWRQLYDYYMNFKKHHIVEFIWVKAHSTNIMNNRVDKLARDRATELI